jgi:hypothetical protein
MLPGMKTICHVLSDEYANVLWKVVIGSVHQCPGGEIHSSRDMGNLPSRVNSGISSPGSDNARLLSGQSSQSVLDDLLNREGVLLPLPAGVSQTTVGDRQSANHLFSSA